MQIRRKEMKRSTWKRIIKRQYIAENAVFDGMDGVAGLLFIEKVANPLSANGVLIADEGFKWLQFAPKGKNFWITAMFDQNDGFVQIYFDITSENFFQEQDNPSFDDLFIDLVLTTEGELQLLDEDELEQALCDKVVTPEQYNLAKTSANQLFEYVKENKERLVKFCFDKMTELKSKLPL